MLSLTVASPRQREVMERLAVLVATADPQIEAKTITLLEQHAAEIRKAHSSFVAASDVPKDFGRLTLARDLAIFTCFFILLHEVGHIVRCHPHFFRRKYGLSVYEEIPLAVAAGDLSRMRVAFEWEADEYAAITSYQILRTLHGHPHFHGIGELGADHAWAISVSMTFALIAKLCGGNMLEES